MSNFLVGLDINDVQVSTFSGNASTTAFTLPVAATTNGAAVHISGVRQVPTTDYSIAATTLTFTTAPPTGTNNIAVMYTKTAILNTPADASVSTAKLAPDAVTGAKIGDDQIDSEHLVAGSVDLEHMSSQSVDEDNLHISNAGSNGNFLSKQSGDAGGLTWAGVSAGFTQGTEQATTSGTGVTFGSIPAGVDMIIINFVDVSLDGTNKVTVQIGDSGGIETSGYTSGSVEGSDNQSPVSGATATDSFTMQVSSSAAQIVSGQMILTLEDAANYTWCSSHTVFFYSRYAAFGGGSKTLSAELTQVKILPNSGNFDAGAVNIMYM